MMKQQLTWLIPDTGMMISMPYLFKTTDYGKRWTDISSNLPDYPINVVFEDAKNPDLLFVGNDIGVYYTLDSG